MAKEAETLNQWPLVAVFSRLNVTNHISHRPALLALPVSKEIVLQEVSLGKFTALSLVCVYLPQKKTIFES